MAHGLFGISMRICTEAVHCSLFYLVTVENFMMIRNRGIPKAINPPKKKRVRNSFGNYVFPFWWFFGGSAFLPVFLAILQHFGAGNRHFNCLCKILELEPLIFHRICNMLVELVTFWSWKLLFQGYLQHFWVRTSHFRWNLQHLGARTVHVTW